MPGKNQHYVPRFLQRGFLHDPLEKAERTWLHRRGTGTRLVGIRSVGVSEYFYSKLSTDGTKTLDDHINTFEGSIGSDIAALRRTAGTDPVDSTLAAGLTIHLVMRTAHLRSVFAQAATQLFEGAATVFNDTAAVRRHLGVDHLDEPTLLGEALDSAALNLPPEAQSIPQPLARRLLSFMAREKFDALYDEQRPMIAMAIPAIITRIPEMVRTAHNKALAALPVAGWETYLKALHWKVHAVSGAILPDCVVLARETKNDFTPFLMSERDNVELVVLPLAHDRLLIGSRSPDFEIAIEDVNAASAACCDDFYISHSAADGADLSHLIGKRSARFIETSIIDALSGVLPRSDAGADRPQIGKSVTETRTGTSFSFSVTCIGFEGTDAVAALGNIVHSIVQELSRSMALSTLEGITFAEDYATAVQNVDRGDPALGADKSQPREYGYAIAKPVKVIHDGLSKTRLVMDASIAAGLLSEDVDDRTSATHILVNMLASIAHTELYENRLSSLTTEPPDEVARILHQAVSMAPCNYFNARESAFVYPDAGERFATLVLDSLGSAQKIIENARLEYRLDGDLDSLLGKALPPISFVLGHAAEWLGHRDGLPKRQPFCGASLPGDLQAFELGDWLELFGRDLRALYSSEDQFTATRVFALSRHVERILWIVQLFPWLTEEGSMYLTVPFGTDIALLESRSSGTSLQSTNTGED